MRIGLFSDPCLGDPPLVWRLREELGLLGQEGILFLPRSRTSPSLPGTVTLPLLKLPGASGAGLGLPSRRVRRLLRGLEAVVVCTPFSLGRLAWRTAALAGLPCLFLFPGRYLQRRLSLPPALRPPLGPVERRALSLARRCSAVGVDSPAVRGVLLRAGIRVPIHLLPWELDLVAFSRPPRHDLRGDLALPRTARVLLHVGRFQQGAPGAFLLRAFRELIRLVPQAFLVLIGGGPVVEELARKAQQLGIASRVRLPGDVDPARLPDYYRQADVFLHVSKRGLGLGPVLAALAAGLPVVAVSRPGAAWPLRDGENALFSPEDELVFAERMLVGLEDGRLRARLREGGLATAQEYSLQASARKLVGLLQELRRS